ncbi:MAG: methionyl-tRNA formyltransferase [Spirochaetes bacterium]|nr:methionyl-tRNA formyltransferase [Spirochaetota bacterium]
MKKYKIGFFSTSEFGEEVFNYLLKNHNIEFVLTTKPKPKGRGYKIENLPFVNKAIENKIKVIYIEKRKEIKESLEEYFQKDKKIDFGIVVDFAFILDEEIFKISKNYFINIHPSILPHYRGPSPIQYTLLNNEKITGVTLQKMTKDCDAGDILYIIKTEILPFENFNLLYNRLKHISVEALSYFFYNISFIKAVPQNHNEATYTKKITKEDSKINFEMDAKIISGKINAFSKWPKVKVRLKEEEIIFLNSSYEEKDYDGVPGQIIKIENLNLEKNQNLKVLFIKCKKNTLLISHLQRAGKKPLTISEFLLGSKILTPGEIFNS